MFPSHTTRCPGSTTGDALADRVDDAAPLVAGHDREAHPARVERSGDDVDVRSADARDDAANARLARPGVGVSISVRLTAFGPLDDDRSHALGEPIAVRMAPVKLEQALAVVRFVVENASAPVSVYVADDHGEIVAAATMDGAAPTRASTRSGRRTPRRGATPRRRGELAAKAREDAAERASFDPFFTFFQGGVAAFEDGRRVGAVGVSGLPGPDDDALARQAIAAAGLSTG